MIGVRVAQDPLLSRLGPPCLCLSILWTPSVCGTRPAPAARPECRGGHRPPLTWWEVHCGDQGIEGTEDAPTLLGRRIWKG